MSSLPAQHPSLALHLTDTAYTPIVTSAHSQQQLESLTALTTTALASHAALSRLGLGVPQRLVVEHAGGGPVLLHSFLGPEAAAAAAAATTSAGGAAGGAAGVGADAGAEAGDASAVNGSGSGPGSGEGSNGNGKARETDGGGSSSSVGQGGPNNSNSHGGGSGSGDDGVGAPMLIALVVAESADDAHEGRRAAARLERLGREFQREWIVEERNDGAADGAE